MSSSTAQREIAMKTRSENGNVQTRTGFFVPPIRRVVYGALAMAAATTLVVATASADAPAPDVEDGPVPGDTDQRLTFEPSLALGAVDEPESASGWVIKGGPYLNLVGIEGEALVAGVTADLDLSFGDIFDNFDLIAMSMRKIRRFPRSVSSRGTSGGRKRPWSAHR